MYKVYTCTNCKFSPNRLLCECECEFQVVHRSREVTAVGSTCCFGENGLTCCRRGQTCCISLGSGSLDIPGFRPMCCDLLSVTDKAQCCSDAAQKSGAIPECCDSPGVKPTCCTTAENKFICCEATIGLSSCCSNIPAYQVQTQSPTSSGLVPVEYQSTQSCCQSSRPQEYCCPRTQTHITYTEVTVQRSTPECCTQMCCARTAYVSACCRKRRRSCCGISSSEQRITCCNQPGLTPSCCPGQPRSTNRRYTNVQVNQPRKTYETAIQQPNLNQKFQIDQSRPQMPNFAPLSCCRASDIQSCCTSGLRRSGGHPLCCPLSRNAVNTQYTGNSGNYYRQQYSTGGSTSQERYPSQHWKSERDDLENLLRSEELQTLDPETDTPIKEFPDTIANKNPYWGKRQVLCSGIPYDTSQFICCSGVLQIKLGSQPACCGTSSFDQSTHTCCNGQVRNVCLVADYPNN